MLNSLRKYYKKHIIATNNPNASRDAAISELNADIANKKYDITEGKTELTTPYYLQNSFNRGGVSSVGSDNITPHIIFDYILPINN